MTNPESPERAPTLASQIKAAFREWGATSGEYPSAGTAFEAGYLAALAPVAGRQPDDRVRVLAAFARTAPGRLPERVRLIVDAVPWEKPEDVLSSAAPSAPETREPLPGEIDAHFAEEHAKAMGPHLPERPKSGADWLERHTPQTHGGEPECDCGGLICSPPEREKPIRCPHGRWRSSACAGDPDECNCTPQEREASRRTIKPAHSDPDSFTREEAAAAVRIVKTAREAPRPSPLARQCEKCGGTDLLVRFVPMDHELSIDTFRFERNPRHMNLPNGVKREVFGAFKAMRDLLHIHCRRCQWWWAEEPGAALLRDAPEGEQHPVGGWCPGVPSDMLPSWRFCPLCGGTLPTVPPEADRSTQTEQSAEPCPQCGKPCDRDENWGVCPECFRAPIEPYTNISSAEPVASLVERLEAFAGKAQSTLRPVAMNLLVEAADALTRAAERERELREALSKIERKCGNVRLGAPADGVLAEIQVIATTASPVESRDDD